MRTLCLALVLPFLGLAVAADVSAQTRWREIGKTSSGNTVFVDPRSVSRDSTGIITATVRTVYAKPVDTPQGPITGTRSVAMFDCAARRVAVKENIIFHDEAANRIFQRSAPRQPGYSTVFTSNFSAVTLDYLCNQPAPTR